MSPLGAVGSGGWCCQGYQQSVSLASGLDPDAPCQLSTDGVLSIFSRNKVTRVSGGGALSTS